MANLFCSPANPTVGDLITFAAVVKNIGRGIVSIGVILGVGSKVDGFTETWSDKYTLGLSPGEVITLTANNGQRGSSIWTATGGIHQITAHVDDIGRIVQVNTDNSLLVKQLVVKG